MQLQVAPVAELSYLVADAEPLFLVVALAATMDADVEFALFAEYVYVATTAALQFQLVAPQNHAVAAPQNHAVAALQSHVVAANQLLAVAPTLLLHLADATLQLLHAELATPVAEVFAASFAFVAFAEAAAAQLLSLLAVDAALFLLAELTLLFLAVAPTLLLHLAELTPLALAVADTFAHLFVVQVSASVDLVSVAADKLSLIDLVESIRRPQ